MMDAKTYVFATNDDKAMTDLEKFVEVLSNDEVVDVVVDDSDVDDSKVFLSFDGEVSAETAAVLTEMKQYRAKWQNS